MADDLLIRCSPAEAGFDPNRWEGVLGLASRLAASQTGSLALEVSHSGRTPGSSHFGWHSPERPLGPGAIFLVASLTKPVVAMAAMLLVERGLLTLADRVSDYLPTPGSARKPMTVRHLLTHTSGLPDMLPDNLDLRRQQAPLSRFLEGACAVDLDFPPGRGVQYQSMGFMLLARIIELVSGRELPDFLKTEIFEPCGMTDTALGAPASWFGGPDPEINRVPHIEVPEEQRGGEAWNWNSRYWRMLGAPWGGLLSTTTDLLRFCAAMMPGTSQSGRGPFSQATIRAAAVNQLEAYADVPEADRRCRGWGFGWRLQWPAHAASFGDLVSPKAFGHWGATGTLFWCDPQTEVAAVLLTSTPLERSGIPLARLSSVIAAARE